MITVYQSVRRLLKISERWIITAIRISIKLIAAILGYHDDQDSRSSAMNTIYSSLSLIMNRDGLDDKLPSRAFTHALF